MKRITIFLVALSSLSAAEKAPDWWCRASSDGTSFLAFGATETEACTKALQLCQDEDCSITDSGQW